LRRIAGDWWNKAEFPAHILPKLAALQLSTPAQRGYSHLFAGLVIAEMTRVDTSIATFFLVHHDLFVESLYAFGSDDQKRRLLDDASNLASPVRSPSPNRTMVPMSPAAWRPAPGGYLPPAAGPTTPGTPGC
jgi:hypothetical protein